MISLDDIDAHDQREWTKALAAAEAFLPKAREIYKAETGKACTNYAMMQVLANFARVLALPSKEPTP